MRLFFKYEVMVDVGIADIRGRVAPGIKNNLS